LSNKNHSFQKHFLFPNLFFIILAKRKLRGLTAFILAQEREGEAARRPTKGEGFNPEKYGMIFCPDCKGSGKSPTDVKRIHVYKVCGGFGEAPQAPPMGGEIDKPNSVIENSSRPNSHSATCNVPFDRITLMGGNTANKTFNRGLKL
jgi:hypothetical protein